MRGPTLAPGQGQVEVDYVAPAALHPGATLRFQYRLGPEEKWSESTEQRSVVFANLAAGSYRFEVRALGASREASEPALVSFRVLAPLWQRPWFVGLVAAGAVALGAGAYRLRVRHLVSLERQRTRIAMDLHDEVGSGLGSIGLLADLAAQDPRTPESVRHLVGQVGDAAFELSTALGDIVWSLRPGSTTLDALAHHFGQHARRLFPAPASTVATDWPDPLPQETLSVGVVRNVLRIGLEALHNAARHAHATAVRVSLVPEGKRWRLVVSDNGCGFDPGKPKPGGSGMGMGSMRRRAEEIAADLTIESAAGVGTTVSLVFDPRSVRRDGRSGGNLRVNWIRWR